MVTALRRDLDYGEAETIAVALDLGADLVLIDEREGRRHAQRLGLRTLGLVGLLIEPKARQLVDRIRPELIALRQQAGFFLSEAVFQEGIRLAGED